MNRYKNIKKETDSDGIQYITNPVYPDIPLSENDVYVITTDADRYDLLALKFYGDPSLWWIIPAANSNTARDTLYPTPGIQIRIPTNKEEILSRFEFVNKVR